MVRDNDEIMKNWLIKRLNNWNFFKLKQEYFNLKKSKNKIKKKIKRNKFLRENNLLKNFIKKKWKKRLKILKFILSLQQFKLYNLNKISYKKNRFNFIKSKFIFKWSFWLRFYKNRNLEYRNIKKSIKRKKIKSIQESIYKHI